MKSTNLATKIEMYSFAVTHLADVSSSLSLSKSNEMKSEQRKSSVDYILYSGG